jgi:CRISPR-associated endonuclease/helicase Cas3
VFKESGKWSISPLTHNSKSLLMDLLEIDSVNCVCESDEGAYKYGDKEVRTGLTLSTRYYVVKGVATAGLWQQAICDPGCFLQQGIGF